MRNVDYFQSMLGNKMSHRNNEDLSSKLPCQPSCWKIDLKLAFICDFSFKHWLFNLHLLNIKLNDLIWLKFNEKPQFIKNSQIYCKFGFKFLVLMCLMRYRLLINYEFTWKT